jgi:hypothetical protein
MRDHVVVSQYFRLGEHYLWNPATAVAQLFYRTADAMAPFVGVPHGLRDTCQDEYDVDPAQFTVFVDALARRYLGSNHAELRTLVEGFLVIAIALARRAGLSVPALAGPVGDGTAHQDADLAGLLARAAELERHMVH